MFYIYQYKNKINGHMYIGLTNDSKRRFSEHLSAANNPNNKDYNQIIHKAIRKYGIENFDYIILEDNIENLKQAKEKEQYWIKYYNTYKDKEHYNETPGGDCPGKNTVHLGEEHGMALLSTEDVIYCRKCYSEGKRSRDIYEKFFKDKITYSDFLRMWHGKNWKHIMPEVFKKNPHRAKYTAADRDIITALYQESGLGLTAFSKTKECYVGYGTLWKMINQPEFYNNK